MSDRDSTRISPAEAHAKMTDEAFTYVDVRTEAEFADGHPDGAVNVPLMHAGAAGLEANPDFVAVMEGSFAKDAPIIVGCKMGGRSARAANALALAGFTRVLDQRAGWDGARGSFGELTEPGWSRAGLPTESGAPPARSYEALRARKP
jgi:rhodanese-related sulfurtransferase